MKKFKKKVETGLIFMLWNIYNGNNFNGCIQKFTIKQYESLINL